MVRRNSDTVKCIAGSKLCYTFPSLFNVVEISFLWYRPADVFNESCFAEMLKRIFFIFDITT